MPSNIFLDVEALESGSENDKDYDDEDDDLGGFLADDRPLPM